MNRVRYGLFPAPLHGSLSMRRACRSMGTGSASARRTSKRLEEILPDTAQDFDAFYRQRSAAPATGSILVAAVDGKSIPTVKPGGAQPLARRTKGQKANKKRMATVATIFTRAPRVRTAQQVVESLFPTRQAASDEAPPSRPENKRVWASLLKGKTAVIQEVAAEMDRHRTNSGSAGGELAGTEEIVRDRAS